MKPVIKKADGTIVASMRDVAVGETVTLSIPRPPRPQPMGMMRGMGMMAQPEGREVEPLANPPAEDSIDLGTFTLNKAASKTPEAVHAALTLTPDQLRARIAAWRERHPEKSEQQLAQAAEFVRAARNPT